MADAASVAMVDDADLDRLRAMVGETPLTEDQLRGVLADSVNEDGSYNFNLAASVTWGMLAAQYAGLVDVNESGSSRKLSDLHRNALSMQAHYTRLNDVALGLDRPRRPRTRAIVRP